MQSVPITTNVVSLNPTRARFTRYNIIWSSLSVATGQWFSPGNPVSSTNKTDHHDITEILLKVALSVLNQQTIRKLLSELMYNKKKNQISTQIVISLKSTCLWRNTICYNINIINNWLVWKVVKYYIDISWHITMYWL
jgi:hypothetical protein